MTNVIETPKAGRREWIALAVIALPCLLYAMDLTVLNLAVPQLRRLPVNWRERQWLRRHSRSSATSPEPSMVEAIPNGKRKMKLKRYLK